MNNIVDISSVGGSVDGTRPLWEVTIDSYRYVLYSTNKVLVYKGDAEAPTYEISNYSCSCPGDRYNANPCKHRKAVSFVGDGSSGAPSNKEPEVSETVTNSRPKLADLDSLL